MPRGVPKGKGKRGASKGLDSFIQSSVKYLRKFSADARSLVLNQIAKELRSDEAETRVTRHRKLKAATVAQEQRQIREAGASTTGNTSGGLKRTQPKVKDKDKQKGSTRKAGTAPADDVSGIPGVAEESTSH